MAVPTLGPWRLVVRDLIGRLFERHLASDGQQTKWLWRIADWALDREPRLDGDPARVAQRAGRALAALEEHYQPWRELKAPWLATPAPLVDPGGVALVTEHVGGVRLSELCDPRRPMPVEAAAWLAAGLARALEQLDERDAVPDLCADSLLVDWEARVRPCPWPDLVPLPAVRSASGVVPPFEYFTPEQLSDAHPGRGWRTWAPAVVLLHAMRGTPPHKGDSPSSTARNIIDHQLADPKVLRELPPPLGGLVSAALGPPQGRPALKELLPALEAIAARAFVDELLQQGFATERSEQQLELDKAMGRDPEAIPPELAQAVIEKGTDEAFGVLGDWLQTQGVPRGELAALQLRLGKGADLEVSRAEAELLGTRRTLLPPLLRERISQWRGEWKAGWLVSLELRVVPDEEELTDILSHPTLRFLRRLRVTPDSRGSLTVAKVLRALQPPALKQVELASGLATHGAWLKEALPQVQVHRSQDVPPLPLRRRPEASDPEARVGDQERKAGPAPLRQRVRGWFTRDD